MFLMLANLPSQLVEFRRLAKVLRGRGETVRLFVEHDSLLTEPGSQLIPKYALDKQKICDWFVTWNPRPKFLIKLFDSFFAANNELRRERPKALIVGEDGVGGNLVWIAVAKKLGIPIIILPYEYSSIKQAYEAILPAIDDFVVSGPLKEIFARWRPAWVRLLLGRNVFRLPFRIALSYELMGVSPRDPWTVHGGRADVILAESPQMVTHYKNEGINPGKIIHTGSLAFDDLYVALKSQHIRNDRLRILCSLPPDYTGVRGPMPYFQLIHLWLYKVGKYGDVIVQAHPHARETLREIGVVFDMRDITELIAETDIFVTSVSSTIRYALAAGRPVLNFDCYGFNYPDYIDAEGCSTVGTVADLETKLLEMVADFDSYKRRAVGDAKRWGVIDGKAADRILAVLGLD